MRYEVRVIGSAGQGSILAAVVLATAAAKEGLWATQTAIYGAAMRSGVSLGDVVISDAQIDFPKPTTLDAVIIQSQEAYDDIVKDGKVKGLKEGGLVIVDKDLVECKLSPEQYKIVSAPIARTAAETLGKRQVMNIVALGVFQVAVKSHLGRELISKESFLSAIESSVPKRFIDLNKKAFEEGVKIGEEAL
jgi:2-oxoglutarate ferredoxin oxidoreductase subunit gamma